MVSIVHGPGTREGMAAEVLPRPTSAWEAVGGLVPRMDSYQKRRVAMFLLRTVCNWRLEDIGGLFSLHKGHVSREIERGKHETAEILRGMGIETGCTQSIDSGRRQSKVSAYLTPAQHDRLAAIAKEAGVSLSTQVVCFLMAGGLDREPETQEAEEEDED